MAHIHIRLKQSTPVYMVIAQKGCIPTHTLTQTYLNNPIAAVIFPAREMEQEVAHTIPCGYTIIQAHRK